MNGTKKILGAPYHFLNSVDMSYDGIAKEYGRKYYENIFLDAPIISIIPGKPRYLPANGDTNVLTQALIAANQGDGSAFLQNIGEQIMGSPEEGEAAKIRYYGFERDMATYIQYVNTLCRTCADFLGVGATTYNGSELARYNWSEYHWGTDKTYTKVETDENGVYKDYFSYWAESVAEDVKTAISSALDSTYLEFFIDPDCSSNESIGNTTGESKIKALFDTGSEFMKELAFVANSGGGSDNVFTDAQDFADASMQQLADVLGSTNDGLGIGSTLKKILSVGGNIVKGENIIMPDIYQSSSYDKSYTFTVHLKSPYGSALAYYLDVIVPLMHLLALALPKQTTANTYGSPFLVKAYVDGIFNCDLGMVTSISINKNVNDTVVNTLGVPAEIDVSITITDLYSDLSMSNVDEDPLLFLSNTSLIEYLATTCGLSLVRPNPEQKFQNMLHSMSNALLDIGGNIKQEVVDKLSDLYMGFAGLGG